MFWKKKLEKPMRTEEFDEMLKHYKTLSLQVATLDAKYVALNTSYDDLRGKFNRKLSLLRKEMEEEEDSPQQNLNRPFSPFGP